MSLYDVARTLVNDYSRTQTGKRWQSYLLSAKLRDLRTRQRLTQSEVAERAGISESAVRNYEQQKSTPKQAHLEALAAAFRVRPEALRLYDIDLIPANALFQLGEIYGLEPRSDKRFAYFKPTNDYMADVLSVWASKYTDLKLETIERDSYEQWKDEFYQTFDPADFPLRYEVVNGSREAIEPWASTQLAQGMQRLRKSNGLTQEGLAALVGTTKATVRSYEQKKRMPKSAQLDELAVALKVTSGSLIFFDFGSPVQAAHALFQIANQHGLIPDVFEGRPVLRTAQPALERYIDQWARALNGVYEDAIFGGASSYQEWKDRYRPDGTLGTDWTSRYRLHFGSTGRLSSAVESDYDPFNEQYDAQGGFLRA